MKKETKVYVEVSKLKSLIKRADLTVKEFAPKVGMSYQGWHQAYHNNDIKLSTFFSVCNVLGYKSHELIRLLNPNNPSSTEDWLKEITKTTIRENELNHTDIIYSLCEMSPQEWVKVKTIVDRAMEK